MTMGVLLGCFRQVQVKFGVAVCIFTVIFGVDLGSFTAILVDFGHFYRDVSCMFR